MEIHLNITFPKMPCELLTLDVMDVSGEQQHGIVSGINKVRLKPQKEGGGEIDKRTLRLYDQTLTSPNPLSLMQENKAREFKTSLTV